MQKYVNLCKNTITYTLVCRPWQQNGARYPVGETTFPYGGRQNDNRR